LLDRQRGIVHCAWFLFGTSKPRHELYY
jgi:hypothetical protein